MASILASEHSPLTSEAVATYFLVMNISLIYYLEAIKINNAFMFTLRDIQLLLVIYSHALLLSACKDYKRIYYENPSHTRS